MPHRGTLQRSSAVRSTDPYPNGYNAERRPNGDGVNGHVPGGGRVSWASLVHDLTTGKFSTLAKAVLLMVVAAGCIGGLLWILRCFDIGKLAILLFSSTIMVCVLCYTNNRRNRASEKPSASHPENAADKESGGASRFPLRY